MRIPITLLRAVLQMTATTSMQKIAKQISSSKTTIARLKHQYLCSGHTLEDLPKLSDIDLFEIIYMPRVPKGFKPWRNDEELFDWFRSTKLNVKRFYKDVYLPSVPEKNQPVQLPYFYRHIRAMLKKQSDIATESLSTVQCFDVSDEVAPSESAPLCRNQVRITLANGASIDFYPGSTSESFVGELLRQNGVKI